MARRTHKKKSFGGFDTIQQQQEGKAFRVYRNAVNRCERLQVANRSTKSAGKKMENLKILYLVSHLRVVLIVDNEFKQGQVNRLLRPLEKLVKKAARLKKKRKGDVDSNHNC